MIANFSLSLKDFNKIVDFEIVKILERSRLSYLNLALVFLSYVLSVTSICLLISMLFDAKGNMVSKTALCFALLPLFIAWILAKSQHILVDHLVRKNCYDASGPHLGDQSLEIKNKSLIWKTDKMTIQVDLGTLKEIEVDEDYIYILYDHAAGIPLPIAAFKTDEDRRAFLTLLSKQSNLPLIGPPKMTGPWAVLNPAERIQV